MTALEPQLLRFPARGASAHCTQLQWALGWGCQQECLGHGWGWGNGDGCTQAAGNSTDGESQLEWVFLKHHWKLHTELPGWLARAHSRLSITLQPTPLQDWFSSPPAILPMIPVCILLVVCRSGHRGSGSGTDQAHPPGRSWAAEHPLHSQTVPSHLPPTPHIP